MYELVYFVKGERFTKQTTDLAGALILSHILPIGTVWLVFNPKGVLLYTDKDE